MRVQEAARLVYRRVVVPKRAIPRDERPAGIEIIEVGTVRQALKAAVGGPVERNDTKPRVGTEV